MYSAPIADGTITKFPDYALLCARAFGALIALREAPASEPIPEELKPDTAYANHQIESGSARLLALCQLDLQAVEEAAQADFQQRYASWEEYDAHVLNREARYRAMRIQVEAWKPPTPEHENFKAFMLSELDHQMGSSPSPAPTRLSPAEWIKREFEQAASSVAYHLMDRVKTAVQTRENSAWIRVLRESLEASQ